MLSVVPSRPEYAQSVGAGFAEVSAKTKEGIDSVFVEIAEKLLANRNAVYDCWHLFLKSLVDGIRMDEPVKPDTIVLGEKQNEKDKPIDDSCCGD